MSAVQILAFLSGLAGLGAIIGATASNEWRVTSRASSVITATWVLQGLWNNCAGNAIGLTSVFLFFSCRGLMISAVCLGFFGSIFALVGMKCTKIGGSDKSKARIACSAGVFFILSGLCSLSACSIYAQRITSEFFDPMFVAQKYELGAALFIGWAGSVLCVVGGVMFCFSIASNFSKSHSHSDYVYKGAALHSHVSSNPRGQVKSINQRPPPQYSVSSRVQNFDKNVYV
uniref:Claudin-10-like n=1 Tax=Salarias fasciatus TaxID=181472 RepID=A0A672JQ11_SALFA